MNRKLKTADLNRMDADTFRNSEKHPFVVVLDSIRSLHNVGSVFRTADAFRVNKMILCGLTACPPHRDIHKTALGATNTVEWLYISEILEAVELLRAEGYLIVVAEHAQNTVQLQDIPILRGQKVAFIFGNEVFGVHQSVVSYADLVVEIPQFGTKHSLNVSVSVGIVLWEAIRLYV